MTHTHIKKHKQQTNKYFKAATIILITLVLSTGLFQNVTAQNEGFPDVDHNDARKTAIEYFLGQSVFTGYPDGTFQPERILNRAEQLKVYMLLMGVSPEKNTYSNCFPDVKEEWFASYVCYAKEQGIIQGYPDGTFRPAQEVNKAEALKMLGLLQKWNTQTPTEPPFADTPVSEWYTPYVTFAKEHNFLGTTGETLNPAGGIPRANTAELMFRSLALYALNQSFYDSLTDNIQQVSLQELADEKRTAVAATEQQSTTETAKSTTTIIEIAPQNGTVQVGEDYMVTFEVLNENGERVNDAPIEISFEHPSETPIIVNALGNGLYNAQIVSTVSGSNIIAIHNKETGETLRRSLIFTPGTPEALEVEEVLKEGSTKKLGTRNYQLMLRDKYGNTLRDVEFRAEATNAYVTMKPHGDGTATAQIDADTYGLSQVVFTGISRGIQQQKTEVLDFIPIGLDPKAAYPAGAENIRIPVLFFLPQYSSQDIDLEYIIRLPEDITVTGFGPKTDIFTGDIDQTRENGVNYVYINGTISSTKTFDGAIGDLVIEQIPEGIMQVEGGITMTAENPLVMDTLYRPGGSVQMNEEQQLYVPLPRPLAAITGKTAKRICIDAFIDPASGVTKEQVESDAKQAEDIFHKNAQNCNCPHWLKIDVSTYTFPQDQWNDVTGGDDVLDKGDVTDFLKKKTPVTPHTWCTKVFYTGRSSSKAAGDSVRISDPNDEIDGVGSFVLINNAKDRDGRTLAHELTHHLSGNQVQDPGKGTAQGAGRQGNLMSYDKEDEDSNITEKVAGDELTKNQCDLIDWSHPRFDAYPSAL